MSDAGQFAYEIAVVGLAGRFPGAKNIDEFWQNLCDGVESVTVFSDEELLAKGVDPSALHSPEYVKAEAVMEDVEMFDAAFFGFTPREAEMMDPQHRLFLEQAQAALEFAGCCSEKYPGRIGVFAGESVNSYLLSNLYPQRELLNRVGSSQTIIGNDRDYLATQVSYKLNLKGPALSVQTACSTSLVAVHLACQSLLNRECDMALAGGVSVSVPHGHGAMYLAGGIISPDGHCRAFDASARGTVKGSGVGVVVLKRLMDALAEGDTIHAVIKGSAINNDGAMKVGYTAPSIEGQARVIEEALAMAGVEPETVSYIEAHGTGTALGDPVEMAALTQAFRTSTEAENFCAIGSVKTNIGHLDAAAGVAGLIKTVLALKHRMLPPSLHFTQPNPNINFAASPFFVNTKLDAWAAGEPPRRAGVSSFGIGGTNVHVVLEEAPAAAPAVSWRASQLLTLSAKTPLALEKATQNLAAYLKQHPGACLADVAYTLAVGRDDFQHRRTLVSGDVAGAVSALETLDRKFVQTSFEQYANRPVVFMFSGQGTQYAQMGRGLYESEPLFREQVDACAQLLMPHLGIDLRDVLYPAAGQADEAARQLEQTRIAQPALFVVEYALAKLLMKWGMSPRAMIGHSLGEFVAACLAGVFSLEDALKVVAARGKLMQQTPGGSMLAISLAARDVKLLLDERFSLAAVNAPAQCVVAGSVEDIEELERKLGSQGTTYRRLHTSHALHSALMQPAVQPFIEEMKGIELRAPQLPYVSSLTGRWITDEEATSPDFWAQHLRETVQFSNGITELLKDSQDVLLEVGPGQTLVSLAKQHMDTATDRPAFSTLRHPKDTQDDVAFLLNSLGKLWLAGMEIDWPEFYAGEQRRRIALPTYPFERQRYWIEPPSTSAPRSARREALNRRRELADWFYVPSWKRSVVPSVAKDAGRAREGACWVVFGGEESLSSQVVRRLESLGADVVSVMPGIQFGESGNFVYEMNPHHSDDYKALMKALKSAGKVPSRILHLWNAAPDNEISAATSAPVPSQTKSFDELISLAQSLGEYGLSASLEIGVVTNGMQAVTGEEKLVPEKATLVGPCKVIEQEYPGIGCRVIDVTRQAAGSVEEGKLVDALIAELDSASAETMIAYRGAHRWVQIFEPLRLTAPRDATRRISRLRKRGVYLLTGGLGELDLALAQWLAQTVRARIVLTGRQDFPASDAWDYWLATHDADDDVSRRIRLLRAMEETEIEVLFAPADVTDEKEMLAVVSQTRERFGKIDGVFHTASVTGGGIIQLKTPEMARAVIAPKVQGTRLLHSLLKESPPDFLVLFSSSLSITGAPGQVDYGAACAFLDAFAQAHAASRQTFVTTIDWRLPHWEKWDVSTSAGAAGMPSEFAEMRDAYGIALADGIEALSRIFDAAQPQVIVSTQDFQALLDEQRNASRASSPKQPDAAPTPTGFAASSDADAHALPPANETEQTITDIWRELFGIERIGIHDNFFELGGNSLLAIQLAAHLRKAFQIEFPLSGLFESPTVAGLSSRISESRSHDIESEEIERLLKEIESLSQLELQSSLAQELQAGNEKKSDG